MSLQDSTFNTAHVLDNEIVKANDFEFAFEKIAENVSRATQMILESNQDFVINGKVLPYQGMNVKVSPIYGVCKSTGIPFGRTEETIMEYGFEESSSGRVDIIEVHGEWETYDNQQRAFNDPDTNVQTYQYVDTKKLMRPVYRIKKGVEGSSVAPEVDDGYVKLAEVVIRANNSTITTDDIKNITADIAGLENTDWTTQPDITYNIGYISDVNERFRVQHNEDGTHKDNVINTDSLNIGIGAKQVNGNVLPIGSNITIPTQTTGSSDTIVSTISKAVTVLTSIYNSYLKYGTYGFYGEIKISSLLSGTNLVKPLSIKADGEGNAVISINGDAVVSIDEHGRISTNGYTPSSDNDIITKKVTDTISTALTTVSDRVTAIEERLASNEIYTNKVLSTDRFSVASLSINAATTANITLSGTQTIDGVALAVNQKVLVKNQSLPKNNGIYNVESSAWTRPSDYNTPNKLKGKIFNVISGTSNGGKMFYIPTETFQNGSAFGSDDINFVEFLGSVAKLANKLVMRNSSGSANLDVNGNVTGNVTGNVIGNYGTCSTAAGTAAKTVACNGFTLADGSEITVKFTVTNTAANPTLNVNSTGALPIYYRGSAISAGYLAANRTYTFRYDGTSYNLVGDLDTNTTYGNVSKTAAGLCPQLPNESTTTKYLRQDGTWQVPPSSVTGVKGNSESSYRTGNVNITAANIGLGSVDNKSFRETAFAGLYITTDTSQLSATSYKFSPTAPVGSTNLDTGSVVRLTFSKALQSTQAIASVSLNYGGRDGVIQAARGSGLVNVASHVFAGGDYSATYKNKVWDAYTTLELMWTGSVWLVMGNPVLCSYFSTTQSYTVYANGLIEQSKIIASAWDTKYTKTWADLGWINYSQIPYVGITLVVGQDSSNNADTRTIEIKSTQVTYRTFGTQVCLFAHGY